MRMYWVTTPEAMADPKYQDLMRRGVIWAATGKVD